MKKLLCGLALLYSASSFASLPNISIDGTIPAKITIHPGRDRSHTIVNTEKDIVLVRVHLAPATRAYLAASVAKQLQHPFAPNAHTCGRVQLGMKSAPVLDQGRHGSCVTFATTASLNAALDAGDYISQLCNLELGSYLNSQDASYPTGWDGSWGDVVIGQIKQYGFINKPSQVFKGCSGYHIYPEKNEKDRGNPMPTSEFTQRSEMLPSSISFTQLLRVSEAISPKMNPDEKLNNAKNALQAGSRVLIGYVTVPSVGEAGALGKYKYNNDSWILTKDIAREVRLSTIYGAHEVVVTGFDDNAVITGPDNTKQKGVITIRNSYGYLAGDWGDFYMSYDYFKTFVFDMIQVKQG